MVEFTIPLVLDIIRTVGILVAIVYYITIMRNQQKNQQQQLDTRQAQLLMNFMNTFRSPEYRRQWHTLWAVEWSDFNDFKDRFHGKDIEVMSAYTSVMTFYETIGVIVRSGLVDIDKVYSLLPSIKMTWERYEPLLMGDRELFGEYTLQGRKGWDGFEYLYNEIIRYDQQHPELKT